MMLALLFCLVVRLHPAAAVSAVAVQYCPDGRSMETGLCYTRCPLGSTGAGCSCWSEGRSSWRGCGVRPRTCEASSFRRAALPAPGPARGPFTLLMSADPQLFRNYTRYDDRRGAETINRNLVRSINRVRDLQAWPADAGGGAVEEPRSMVVLGDLTEFYMERQQDGFRHFYDPSYPGSSVEDRVRFPTWLMLGVSDVSFAQGACRVGGGVGQSMQWTCPPETAKRAPAPSDALAPTYTKPQPQQNHDYVNNVHHCSEKTVDADFCAKWAVNMMRSALSPDCPHSHFTGLPRSNITSFDAGSMAYAFDYERYHFVVLHHSPRYDVPEIGVSDSMAWLARELAHATAQQRRIVILMHAHKELRLPHDPTFAKMIESSNVVALFYGHVHIRPWGLVGRYPNTTVPIFNCGASWYNVYCLTEFAEDGFRVGVVAHFGDGKPSWFGSSLHSLPRGQRAKPVLEAFVPNPNVTTWVSGDVVGLVVGWLRREDLWSRVEYCSGWLAHGL